jgi:hypothetical protein
MLKYLMPAEEIQEAPIREERKMGEYRKEQRQSQREERGGKSSSFLSSSFLFYSIALVWKR